MKKLISVSLVMIFIGISIVKSQDCTFYFPSKPGTVMVVNHYKDKDKLTGTSKTKILEATGSAIKFSGEYYNDQNKLVNSGDYEVKCKNGEFVVDMSSFTRNMPILNNPNMKVDIQIDTLSIPSDLKPGMQLKDGAVRMTMTNAGVAMMKITIKIINRTVVDFEDVTTPAGTFNCAKITYDVESEGMMSTHTKAVEYVCRHAGVVKTESHDSNGKLLSYSLLNSITE